MIWIVAIAALVSLVVLVVSEQIRYQTRTLLRYTVGTCGDDQHVHRVAWTAGRAPVVICGPATPESCGDDSHLHLLTRTTIGDRVYVCFDRGTHERYKVSLIRRLMGVHNGSRMNIHPPATTPPEERQ